MIPYPDPKVATVLCIGGAVKYMMREGSNVSSEFILTHAFTDVVAIFPRGIALVLGTALLWSYYDDATCQLFPQPYVEEIKTKVAQFQGTFELNENPVKKVHIISSGCRGILVITDYEEVDTPTHASIQDSRSHTQVKTAAILQQMQFLKQ